VKTVTWMRAATGALFLTLAGSAMAAAASTDPANVADAYIPFASHGGIRDWEADRTRGLWVQDVHRKWYYAKLMGPCIGLNFAHSIGFDTHPLGRFDKFSAIIVPGSGRCVVQTFTRSDAPPPKKERLAAG
jgi:hypothetical protein